MTETALDGYKFVPKTEEKKNHNFASRTKNLQGQSNRALTAPTWKGLVMSGAT